MGRRHQVVLPEAGLSPLERVSQLFRGVRADSTVIVILDGLDEITSRDPQFAEESLLPLAFDRVTWLLVGRHDPLLERLLSDGIGTTVFPEGLPRMSDDDIRFMLFKGLVRHGDRLLRLDTVTENPLFRIPRMDGHPPPRTSSRTR